MSESTKPILTLKQARVFACLVEKHLATPKNYPLTIHSLMLACNQKSNRKPVMNLDEGQVEHLAKELVELDLARIDYGARAKKVMHRAMGQLKINREQAAIVCMLILRESLTIADIKARTEKMIGFESIAAVQEVVKQLLEYETPLIVQLPKTSGQREERYTHTLCGEIDISEPIAQATRSEVSKSMSKQENQALLTQRIDELENRVQTIEKILNDLMN